MTIQTKFDIGEIVYFIANNKVCSAPIIAINIQIIRAPSIKITYTMNCKGLIASLCDEDSIFRTKEELLKSL